MSVTLLDHALVQELYTDLHLEHMQTDILEAMKQNEFATFTGHSPSYRHALVVVLCIKAHNAESV